MNFVITELVKMGHLINYNELLVSYLNFLLKFLLLICAILSLRTKTESEVESEGVSTSSCLFGV